MGLYLPPPQAFLIVFFLAERTIGILGENKRARAGAGSERSSSPPHDSVRPSSLANYYTFFLRGRMGRIRDYIKTNLTPSYEILLFIVSEFQLVMPQL